MALLSDAIFPLIAKLIQCSKGVFNGEQIQRCTNPNPNPGQSSNPKVRTDKLSVIDNRLLSNIGNRLSAKFNQYAIPDKNTICGFPFWMTYYLTYLV